MHDLLTVVSEALRLAIWLALPALGVSFAVSLLMGAGQAFTQLSDPVLNAIPRALLVALTLGLSAAWMGSELSAYSARLLSALPELVR